MFMSKKLWILPIKLFGENVIRKEMILSLKINDRQ